MDTRLILYIAVLLMGFILGTINPKAKSNRLIYIFFVISLLVLESCLRHVNVGLDTINYYTAFIDMQHVDWIEVKDSFYDAYVLGSGKDPGFIVFMKCIQSVTHNFQLFLFICALIFFVPLGIILYRYSTNTFQLTFAFILYLSLFHIVALSGVRQQIATGFTFMAFLTIGNKKILMSILLTLLGALIHISALFFLLVPFIYLSFKKLLKPIHIASLFLVPIVALFSNSIIVVFTSFLANDYYAGYADETSAGAALTYIIMMTMLSIFCMIFIKKRHIQQDNNIALFYVMLPLLTLMVPLTFLNGTMIRIGQYFTIYMMLLVPFAIDRIPNTKNKSAIYWIASLFLIFMSFRSDGLNYMFFWQNY